MRLPLRCAALTISLMAAAACSHNVTTELPTAPTPVPRPVTLAKLTITPPGGGSMIVGTVVPITSSGSLSDGLTNGVGAFAQYSDGSGKYVEAAWTSSDSNVAVVREGTLVAVGRGTATMTATVQGMSATETFVVEPGIPGLWVGNYVVDTCQAGSGSVDELVCAAPSPNRTGGFLRPGAVAPIAMQINQSGKDLSAATQMGEIRGVLTGSDLGSNYLGLSGNLSLGQTNVKIVVLNARARGDVMEGVLAFEVSVTGLPSWAVVTAHFDNLARK